MSAKIQIRRDTSANWAGVTLANGEIGLDTTLKQIKIGDGSTAWAALPWLGGSFPVFTTPNADANDATNRVQGIYRFADASTITNGPAAPINIVANDGGATMLVIVADSHVVQQLWTDGDGSTQVPKSYSRVYDHGASAWRPWAPQSSWGISATEGVDLIAKSITLKDTGTGLTVDGNSTLTGNVTVNGTTTLGNANADIVTVQAGTAAAPIITTSGDTDTGIAFTAANTIALSTGGTARITIADAVTAIANNLNFAGQLAAAFHCGSQRLTNVGTPSASNDALSWQAMLDRIAIVAGATNGGPYTASNNTSWNLSNMSNGSAAATFTPVAGGTYDGIAMSFQGGVLSSSFTAVRNNVASMQANTGNTDYLIVIAIRRS